MSSAKDLEAASQQLGALRSEVEEAERIFNRAHAILNGAFSVFDRAVQAATVKLDKLTGRRGDFYGIVITLSISDSRSLVYSRWDGEWYWHVPVANEAGYRREICIYDPAGLRINPGTMVRFGLTIDDFITIASDVVKFLADLLRPEGQSPNLARHARLDEIEQTLTRCGQ